MASVTFHNVTIRGVVCAVPNNELAVESLGAPSWPDFEQTRKVVGLDRLYRVKPGQTAGDLCVGAAQRLLEQMDWTRDSVDALILVTQTPDHFLPATACVAHARLELSKAALAFDVGMGCSGYVYGLFLAGALIAAGACKRVLLLAGDTISRLISEEDKSVALLFGDAGSATAVELGKDADRATFVLGTDGSGWENLIVRAGAFRARGPETTTRLRDEAGNLRAATELFMDGIAILNFSTKEVPALVERTLQLHGWEANAVDAFLFHQANAFMLKRIIAKLKIPPERAPINIGRYGNTSMASIPLLLADDCAQMLSNGTPSKIVMAGFGVGYSWGSCAMMIGGGRCAEVVKL